MFNFNTKNSGEIRGFFNDITKNEKEGIAGIYSIYANENGKHKEYNRTVRIDKNGKKFFTWNKEKVMFDDFICDTPAEFVEKVKNNVDRLYGDDLCRTLLKYGMDSIHVKIRKNPMDLYNIGGMILGFETKFKNKEDGVWVEYKFTPEYLHNPINSYKLKMVPVNPEYIGVFSRWDTYVDDMVALFKKCTDTYDVVVNEEKAA